ATCETACSAREFVASSAASPESPASHMAACHFPLTDGEELPMSGPDEAVPVGADGEGRLG
ncbi:MAG: hypothetical protein ACP5VR_10225, partial [Acidimicrobiales bacterium]